MNSSTITEIMDMSVPFASGASTTEAWALLNFIIMIGAVLLSVLSVICIINNKRKCRQEVWVFKFLTNILACVAVVFFILTENTHLPRVLTDKYTWVMAIIFMLQIMCLFVSRVIKHKHKREIYHGRENGTRKC